MMEEVEIDQAEAEGLTLLTCLLRLLFVAPGAMTSLSGGIGSKNFPPP
jgi:hypothetical protein